MKQYYRTRFILGAMLAFLILLVLAMTGIWLFSYRQMERDTDDFIRDMQSMEEDSRPTFTQSVPPPISGSGSAVLTMASTAVLVISLRMISKGMCVAFFPLIRGERSGRGNGRAGIALLCQVLY